LSQKEVSTADGKHIKVPYVGPVKVAVGKQFCFVGALVYGNEVILGAAPMREMGLVIDPSTRRLIAKSPIISQQPA